MTQSRKTRYGSFSIVKLFLFALLLAGGVASSANAQDLVRGTFILNTETRFGTTLLPAGHYTVSVAPLTTVTGPASRVLIFVRPDAKSGPVASLFALASAEACDTPSGLTLASDGAGLAARSLCLSKQGLMIDFDLSRFNEMSKVKAVASVRP
jgi:hypothetical protein